MSINWYPGHMVTARSKAAETMRKTDLVIEVLDARAPHASCNPVFERLRLNGHRPALKLLNKSDLADPEQTRRWLQHYKSQPGVRALELCAKKSGALERVLGACRALRPDRGAADKPLRMMILGIPNVGKSTLMNVLLQRHVAHVGDEPAITKVQMFHRLGLGMSLVDTPGMLWPGMAQETAGKLAALHSVGRAAYDDEEVALTLGRYLLRHYSELLARRFGVLPRPCDEHTLLALIAAGRSLAKKSGGVDVARASVALLNDFRTGTLGRITLETVEQLSAAAWT
jgi:ribosome biogenesis GTPase A